MLALALVQVLVATGVLGFRWLTASTPVEVSQALERFRSGGDTTDLADADVPTGSIVPVVEPTPSPTPNPKAKPSRSPSPSPATPTPVPLGFPIEPPASGVYEWDTVGWEQAANLRRDLPDRSVRLISSNNSRTWMNEHEYSEQHTDWFPLTISEQGVFNASFRARVVFGPFTQDQTLRFDPPLRFATFPSAVGQRWEGAFTGGSSGTYNGRTFERTSMDVGGERVDVWGIEVAMELHEGEVTGTVVSKIWVAERHRLTVKEEWRQDLVSGPGSYRGEWTITLRSLMPRR